MCYHKVSRPSGSRLNHRVEVHLTFQQIQFEYCSVCRLSDLFIEYDAIVSCEIWLYESSVVLLVVIT